MVPYCASFARPASIKKGSVLVTRLQLLSVTENIEGTSGVLHGRCHLEGAGISAFYTCWNTVSVRN